MLLFYIRHGDPIYNPDSLTPLGHRQAESVAKRLSMFGIDEMTVGQITALISAIGVLVAYIFAEGLVDSSKQ